MLIVHYSLLIKTSNYIQATKEWIADFVIGLQLCPFAKVPFQKDQIHYHIAHQTKPAELLMQFWNVVTQLDANQTIATSVIIIPKGLEDFDEYLDLYYAAESLLEAQGKNINFQLASFHPDYQFEDAPKDAVSNYTNRSPYPLIHLLRVEAVTEAIKHYPDVDLIPQNNIDRLNELGLATILKKYLPKK